MNRTQFEMNLSELEDEHGWETDHEGSPINVRKVSERVTGELDYYLLEPLCPTVV